MRKKTPSPLLKDTLSSKLSVCASYTQQPSPHIDGKSSLGDRGGEILSCLLRSPSFCLPPTHLKEQLLAMVPEKIIDARGTGTICLSRRLHSSISTSFWEDEARFQSTSHRTREGKGGVTVHETWLILFSLLGIWHRTF